jgi:hypothetical protein
MHITLVDLEAKATNIVIARLVATTVSSVPSSGGYAAPTAYTLDVERVLEGSAKKGLWKVLPSSDGVATVKPFERIGAKATPCTLTLTKTRFAKP